MNEFLNMLRGHIEIIKQLTTKIENEENYLDELRGYLPSLNQMITVIFEMIVNPRIQLDVNQDFILQVLNDIVYGIEQEDAVFLLDVLRYGLLELYEYIGAELQGEESYE